MSDIIDESAFIGSNDLMGDLIAPKTQEESREERSDEQANVRAALLPAVDILTAVIDDECEKNSNLRTYAALVEESKPSGDAIYQEFRARELYGLKLKQLRKLLQDAAAANGKGAE